MSLIIAPSSVRMWLTFSPVCSLDLIDSLIVGDGVIKNWFLFFLRHLRTLPNAINVGKLFAVEEVAFQICQNCNVSTS